LGTQGSSSAANSKSILSSKIANQKHKNAKNATLNRFAKGHLFMARGLKGEAACHFVQPWLGDGTHWATQAFPCWYTSRNDCESGSSAELGVSNTF
jgi:hypothetical protein